MTDLVVNFDTSSKIICLRSRIDGEKISALVMSPNMHDMDRIDIWEFISTIPAHDTHKQCKSAVYKGAHMGMQNKQIIGKLKDIIIQ